MKTHLLSSGNLEFTEMEILKHILESDSHAETRHYAKGHVLQRTGDSSSRTFYVKKGLLRSYIIDSKGKENIFMFGPEGWIVADIESQEFEQPAELFIDCLEDTEVVIFNKKNLVEPNLNAQNVEDNLTLLYRRMGMLQRRVLMLMSSPAIDRYNYFLQTYPELPNRVPQHMIAAYLGITPQALSTIRSKIARKSS